MIGLTSIIASYDLVKELSGKECRREFIGIHNRILSICKQQKKASEVFEIGPFAELYYNRAVVDLTKEEDAAAVRYYIAIAFKFVISWQSSLNKRERIKDGLVGIAKESIVKYVANLFHFLDQEMRRLRSEKIGQTGGNVFVSMIREQSLFLGIYHEIGERRTPVFRKVSLDPLNINLWSLHHKCERFLYGKGARGSEFITEPFAQMLVCKEILQDHLQRIYRASDFKIIDLYNIKVNGVKHRVLDEELIRILSCYQSAIHALVLTYEVLSFYPPQHNDWLHTLDKKIINENLKVSRDRVKQLLQTKGDRLRSMGIKMKHVKSITILPDRSGRIKTYANRSFTISLSEEEADLLALNQVHIKIAHLKRQEEELSQPIRRLYILRDSSYSSMQSSPRSDPKFPSSQLPTPLAGSSFEFPSGSSGKVELIEK